MSVTGTNISLTLRNVNGSELTYSEPATPVPNPRISELKSELADLDIKRIRPTAEGDIAYLSTLNAQAVALRAELQALLDTTTNK